MRWKGQRRSDNVQDRRGATRGMALGGAGFVIVLLIGLLMGADPRQLLQQLEGTGLSVEQPPPAGTPAAGEPTEFVSVILGSTEDVWHAQFRQMGTVYEEPQVVVFSHQIQSACGMAGSAVGPFYCPRDRQVYLDLDFFRALDERLGAPGDFAQAYVIAHEVGHHVQTLLGISQQVHEMQGRVSEAEYNQLSVRLELQADFFAGVWAHHSQEALDWLEPGDVEEGLTAASAIGDDRLQQRSQGYVVPDAFTHGTSEQRVRWFRLGLETGDVSRGDTFAASRL